MKSERLLSLNSVINKIDRSKGFVYAQMKAGNFPTQVKCGYASSWVESEIDEWISNLKQDRNVA